MSWIAISVCLQGDELMVKVNKLTSIKTQLPYTYYSLPFCKPNTIVDSSENLGEVLRGDRIENSPYAVSTVLYKDQARFIVLTSMPNA
jgi:transmembrane 9 superfamily protein 2/4